ncbi:Phage Mu protein F like protein [Tistlia consotensis]|uniref:Phage Mu protein F like protein n=1 Tax=Tistlia consotensis USBA 355 TaxID=560819 RepID=A0A1Y6CS94_9PROT|nr:PBECR2 nuclease fold domain-containing protein [Tistlia consotensis]SMF85346.1 Phage Mu protein F like protein [Tistlia consotensis USBA 355]SNS37959.1 Phage Mu protein F like protein [Tistlia consotensis]
MADPFGLPFDEAIAYWRQKVPIPTRRWDDLWQGAHTRGFMVAGAMRDDLLADFQVAIGKAIESGSTIEEFRRDFDRIVERYGWTYNGGRGWRTRVIYQTNLDTAYQAGRYAQMTDPDVLSYRPYWRYRHGGSLNPRHQHQAWDGLVLAADDPWWETHYPPNGWGCSCYVEAITKRELQRLGKSGPDQAPDDGTYQYLDKRTGQTIEVPRGIDPGWAYNVGEAAYGRRLTDDAMAAWRAQGAAAWEQLTPGDWQSAGLPATIPVDAPKAKLGPAAGSIDELRQQIETAIGGAERLVTLPDGDRLLVNAAGLAEHLPLGRAPFVPFLPELLDEPAEIWLAFERHKGTGKVELRKRLVKLVQLDRTRPLLMVAQARKGVFEAWTMIPARDPGYAQRQRVGRLLWKRK